MRQVQLHEEERQFAALVAEAEAGESLTTLRQGRSVAQIVPFPTKDRSDDDREATHPFTLSKPELGDLLG